MGNIPSSSGVGGGLSLSMSNNNDTAVDPLALESPTEAIISFFLEMAFGFILTMVVYWWIRTIIRAWMQICTPSQQQRRSSPSSSRYYNPQQHCQPQLIQFNCLKCKTPTTVIMQERSRNWILQQYRVKPTKLYHFI